MLQKLIHISIQNKLLVMLGVGVMAAAGIWASLQIPLDAVPDITNNQVQVITACPSLATQDVEQFVTFPIEQSLATLPKLVEMRSVSRFGLSVVTAVFTDDTDIYFARQQITEHLKHAESELPEGAGSPELAPPTTGLGEIFQYVIRPAKGAEHKYSAMDLRTLQDWVVARQLYGTPGIAEVNSFGGLLKQYEVSMNPEKLKSYNVSIPEIITALSENNQNTGGAYIDKKPNAYFIRGIGTVANREDIGSIVIRANPNGTPLFVRDVANVKFGSAVRYGALTYNGKEEAVGGMVLMLKGANSFDVVGRVKEKIQVIQKSLPSDVVIEPYLDRTSLIKRAIATVEKNLLEGALIVVFVLVLFLGNFRAGLIVASAIPLSMLFALFMMWVFGVSANLMSLGAIDFGLIVDGAVIIVEATIHYLQGSGKGQITQPEMDAIVEKSAGKMMSNATFGQIIILIVYLPILSLQGIEGKMFRPMAQTVGFAIIGALLLSLTYIPVMCTWVLSKKVQTKASFSDKMIALMQRIYTPILRLAIRLKYMVILASVGVLILSIMVFGRLGGEFIPTLQEGDFNFDFLLPQGASLSQSVETSMQAARMIREFPEVKMVIGKTGTSEIPMDLMPTEGTDMIIILKDQKDWTTTHEYLHLGELMAEKLRQIPGVFVEQSQPIQMRFNDLMTGVTQDVAVKIFGEHLDTLAVYADKVAAIIQEVEGAGEPKVQRITGLPQITIEYNRELLAQYGINIKTVNQVISAAFAGEKAGVVFENEKKFELVVRLDSSFRNSIQNVADLYIPLRNGEQIPLSQVAKVGFKEGPAEVGREEGKRRVVIGFNLKGRDVQSVVEELKQKLEAQIKLPVGYSFTYGGTFENLQKATRRLQIALPIALLLIFIMLYFTFTSVSQATLIFTAIPMSAIGGIFALALRDMPFSISAGVGFIALFGVAVLNGIVLIGTFNDLKEQGMEDTIQRVLEGTKLRLRPVLMTAAVASLGFLPMALSSGAGAEVQKPLATVVIGGLITATLLTLIVLPLLYILFTRKKHVPTPPSIPPAALIFPFMLGALSLFGQVEMPMDKVIELGMKHNLSLRVHEAEQAASNEKIKTAYELPKTGFFIENEDLRPSDWGGILKIGISHSLEYPSVYRAKSSLYTAQSQLVGYEKGITELEIKREIQQGYYQLWYLSEKKKLFLRLDSIYASLADAAILRQKTGEGTGLERIAAEAQRRQLTNQIAQLQQDFLGQQQILMQWIHEEILVLPPNTPLSKIKIDKRGELGAWHPVLLAAKQQITIAEQAQVVERKKNLPDFSGRVFSQALYGMKNPFNGFSLSVNVPVFSKPKVRNQLALLATELEKAKFEHQSHLFSVSQRLAITELTRAETALKFYETEGKQQANDILAAATLSYKSGEISYPELSQYLVQAIDIHKNYLMVLNEYNQAAIQYLFYFYP